MKKTLLLVVVGLVVVGSLFGQDLYQGFKRGFVTENHIEIVNNPELLKDAIDTNSKFMGFARFYSKLVEAKFKGIEVVIYEDFDTGEFKIVDLIKYVPEDEEYKYANKESLISVVKDTVAAIDSDFPELDITSTLEWLDMSYVKTLSNGRIDMSMNDSVTFNTKLQKIREDIGNLRIHPADKGLFIMPKPFLTGYTIPKNVYVYNGPDFDKYRNDSFSNLTEEEILSLNITYVTPENFGVQVGFREVLYSNGNDRMTPMERTKAANAKFDAANAEYAERKAAGNI